MDPGQGCGAFSGARSSVKQLLENDPDPRPICPRWRSCHAERHTDKLDANAEENALYLRHPRQSGNATMAAGFAKRARETFTGRRADPDFDAECEAALTFARAALARKGPQPAASRVGGGGMLAAGGEYMVGPNLNNGLQVRRARPGHVTAKGEAAFLEALAATANIALAAEAVGVDPRAFYKRRAQSAEFARRMQDALAVGYEAVEFALLNTALRSLASDRGPAGEEGVGPVEPGRVSIDQAMTLVAQRNKTMAIGDRQVRGEYQKPATREESNAVLLRLLGAAEKRVAAQEAREAKPATVIVDGLHEGSAGEKERPDVDGPALRLRQV